MPDQTQYRNTQHPRSKGRRSNVSSTVLSRDNHLLCPTCGEDFLHAESVRLVNRREDGPASAIEVADDQITVIPHQPIDSPSPVSSVRRGWIEVRGTCEFGCPDWVIVIQQHKGNTFVTTHSIDEFGR